MVEMGVLDPTKVTRYALQHAASVASLMLTTDALVAELPKEEPAGGMGGDGRWHGRNGRHGRHGYVKGLAQKHLKHITACCRRSKKPRFGGVLF